MTRYKIKEKVLKKCYFIGELTDELDTGDYSVEFRSGGPKNYTYVTAKGNRLVRSEGLTSITPTHQF